jgi:hypothetical protein
MKSIFFDRNIQRAALFANQILASVTECHDNKWFVCVDTYAGMDRVNSETGNLPNPTQRIATLTSEADAIAFAKQFNPHKLTIHKDDFYLPGE